MCLVLVVEDDQELARSLSEVLEEVGYRAVWASNGREALAFLNTNTPNLLLVDLFMPVMGGIEFLHTLNGIPALRDIPRIIMTAANDHMVGVKEDATVLYKPIDLDALKDLVRHHCLTVGSAPMISPTSAGCDRTLGQRTS